MIGRVRGEVIERGGGHVVVDVGGVGYVVAVTVQAPFRVGERVDLFIHTAVRDDAISLFGFATKEENMLFDLLIGVPGVGPVKAMSILQTPASTFVELVARREPAGLARLPGVGKKTAERILVDLADKIAAIGTPAVRAPAPVAPTGALADLRSALVHLGFKDATAEASARAAVAALGEDAPLEALIREALSRSRPAG